MNELEPDFSEAQYPGFYKFARHAVAGYIRTHGGLNVVGAKNFSQEGRVILTANHESMNDPLSIGVAFPRALYSLAKKELWSPRGLYIGRVLGRLGSIPVDRKRAGHNNMRKSLEVTEKDRAFLSFLQGTRKHESDEIEGKDGLAWLATRSSTELIPCPVVPIGLSTSNLRFHRPIQLVAGEPIYGNPGGNTQAIRKAFTRELEASVFNLRAQALQLDKDGAGRSHCITTEG